MLLNADARVFPLDGELPAAPAPHTAGRRRSRRHQEPRDSASSQRPGGEEAGRAGPHGPNAGDVQLHAGKQVGRLLARPLINGAVLTDSVVNRDFSSSFYDIFWQK